MAKSLTNNHIHDWKSVATNDDNSDYVAVLTCTKCGKLVAVMRARFGDNLSWHPFKE